MVRDEIVGYLEEYVASFDPPLVEGVAVDPAAAHADGVFELATTAGDAAPPTRSWSRPARTTTPSVPRMAERLPDDVIQLHSSQYRNPGQLPEGAVLVVGTGQSGCQIAEDLHLAGRRVHLAVGGAPRVARFYRGRDVVAWLDDMGHYGKGIDEFDDADAVRMRANHYVTGRDGGRDIDLRAFARDGMRLYGRLTDIAVRALEFAADLKVNLDHADAVAEGIKDAIDAYIAAHGHRRPGRAPLRTGLGAGRAAGRHSTWPPPGSRPWSGRTGFRRDHRWIEAPGLRRPRLPDALARRDQHARPATSWACPGSTPGARAGSRRWAGTRSSSRTTSTPRAASPTCAAALTGAPAETRLRPPDRLRKLRNRTWSIDAHRHIGVLPAYPFYGGPPVNPDTTARATVDELIADLDAEGTERALVMPNYGVPDPAVAFSFNELVRGGRAERRPDPRRAVGVAARRRTPSAPSTALALAGERRRAGAQAELPARRARRRTPPAARSWTGSSPRPRGTTSSSTCTPRPAPPPTSTRSATSSSGTATEVPVHLVHFGGGMSGHIKLAGSRFFDWIDGRQARLHRPLLGHRLRPALAGPGDRAPRHRPRPGAVRQRPAVGRLRRRVRPAAPPRPAAANSATWSSATPSPRSTTDPASTTPVRPERQGDSHVRRRPPNCPTSSRRASTRSRTRRCPRAPASTAPPRSSPTTRPRTGETYFTLVHGIAHESSVCFVAVLQATRALRKGFETAIYFYGPGSLNCLATRGFPTTGNSAFPGEHNINNQLKTFIAEGGKVFCCRFGLSLHGAREEDLIEGVIPTHPLDVQDALIHYARKGAIINSTYQL